jgi:alpha-tubulin suppressor-like RCC1 family protein
VYAFGRNNQGQLGIGTYTDQFIPNLISSASFNYEKIKSVSAGYVFSLCLTGNARNNLTKESGKVYSFGWNYNGQLGSGSSSMTMSPSPFLIPPTTFNSNQVTKIAAGNYHSLVITSTSKFISYQVKENCTALEVITLGNWD